MFFNTASRRPVGATTVIIERTIKAFKKRKTQITACELMMVAVLLHNEGEGLRGLDVVFYVDNQAAVYSPIKGMSGSQDLKHLAAFVHAKCSQSGFG